MLKAVVLCLALFGTCSATVYSTQDDGMLQYMWKQFKSEHQKSYATETEESQRFKNFQETLKLIDERNRAETGTAVHGITKFADLSQEEFAKRYLRTEMPQEMPKTKVVSVNKPTKLGEKDWSGIYTTPIKDQGHCGSCWAFSVSEQVESDSMRQSKSSYILSPQELVSCDTTDLGCNGGWPTNAYDWIEQEGGLVQEDSYPYTSYGGETGTCIQKDLLGKVVNVTDYYQLDGERSMTFHTLTTGPLAIAVDASQWSTYTGGILSVCGTGIDHAVQVVGVNTNDGYWKVRNSWGTSWGESGYIRLQYGQNTCGLTTIPTYTDTELV